MNYKIIRGQSSDLGLAIQDVMAEIERLQEEGWFPLVGGLQALAHPTSDGKIRYIILREMVKYDLTAIGQ